MAVVSANFAGKRIRLRFENSSRLDYADYVVRKVLLNGEPFMDYTALKGCKGIRISRSQLASELSEQESHTITVILDRVS